MNRIMWVLALVVASLWVAGCDKPGKDAETSPVSPAAVSLSEDWQHHLARYPEGWVSSEAPLLIRFQHDVISEEQLNRPQPNLISLSPSLPVQVTFVARDLLQILPAQKLRSGQSLAITLHPVGLDGVPSTLSPQTFQVRAIEQDFSVTLSGLIPIAGSDNAMSLSGELSTADVSELNEIQRLIKVEHDGEELSVIWDAAENRRDYRFRVDDIVRSAQETALQLRWDGAILGAASRGQRELRVPAIARFEITGHRVVQHPEVYVEVLFTEPLDRNQNLNGLVQLNQRDARVRVDGSVLRVYPAGAVDGDVVLSVSEGIRSTARRALPAPWQQTVTFSAELPGVRFVGDGAILPSAAQLSVPFEAVNVDSVHVIAHKVHANTLEQYLQQYRMNSTVQDYLTGNVLWSKAFSLPEIPRGRWQRFHLDLTELMARHPEGMVRLELRINRSHSIYPCEGPRPAANEVSQTYDYGQRNNPCHDAYYSYGNRHVSARSFFASNLGLLVKKGAANKFDIVVTDLLTAQPIDKAQLTLYSLQRQPIGRGQTDRHGMASLQPEGQAFYLVARHGSQLGYLRIPAGDALPTNQFDTGGEHVRNGLKGFLYGERDVWRPGDDIHLTFILEQQDNSNQSHPVTLELYDPRGTRVASQTRVDPLNDFYTFTLRTAENAPTGNWRALVRAGGATFDKTLKIETIVPNRLKVNLSVDQEPLTLARMPVRTELFGQWLHGATASNLKADTEVRLVGKPTRFSGWTDYRFDDPVRSFSSSPQKVFDGRLDAEGRAAFPVALAVSSPPPGMLSATFITRIFEQSGNFSTAIRTLDVMPFSEWVGIHIPAGSGYYDAVPQDRDHPVLIQMLDAEARPLANREVAVSVYRMDWRWWWHQEEEDLANYLRREHHLPVAEARVRTNDKGQARWQFDANQYEWGRHLVRVCHQGADHHCTGQIVYLGWSSAQASSPDAATQLMLSTDKEKYQVGDNAKVRLPALRQGRVLLSLENGSQVLEKRWLDLKPGQTEISIPITAAMAPNVYVHMTLLLPHQQRETDAPIRLYGIVPLHVEDPATRLAPTIEAADKVRPESTFRIRVAETDGKAMTYTLALVDEGLLGITGYRAPDPHHHFYRREALGVTTWDLFDLVVGAYGAALERVLAIGGSDGGDEDERQRRERRFPPVVKFLGVFEVAAGKHRDHEVTLPPYLGAVRVMVVAGHRGAYGRSERTVTVTQPLGLLATLPRVVGPGESIALPVNVFVSEPGIDKVQIEVEADDLFIVNEGRAALTFSGPGDAITSLGLTVSDRIGKGRVRVVASSGSERAHQEIFIESRSPNGRSVISEERLLAPGEQWHSTLVPHGMAGTNTLLLTVSGLPPMKLEERLGYLIGYPHGCLEQTLSQAFPQLYLPELVNLTAAQRQELDQYMAAAIRRLASFQNGAGGFTYWPGEEYVNDWSSSYAGHFLLEAKRLGYAVPADMLQRWQRYQAQLARAHQSRGGEFELVAAYRLYTLALAGQADVAAMNRLREGLTRHRNDNLSSTALRLLALTYQHLGLTDVASELSSALDHRVPRYQDRGYTYGSELRDEGIMLMVLSHMNQNSAAWLVAERIGAQLSSENWYSTQSLAWALMGMTHFARAFAGSDDGMRFAAKAPSDNRWQAMASQQHLARQPLAEAGMTLRNDTDRPLRFTVSNSGIPAVAEEQISEQGLSLQVRYLTMDGKPLQVNSLPQGTDFIAEATVSLNPDGVRHLEDIALSMVMPSGWQIRNERLEGGTLPAGIDYLDIRDDRLLAYFSLWRDYHWSWRYQDRHRQSITVRAILNASYAGRFYLPGWQVEAMYDAEQHAHGRGQWVEVVAP
ncbi:MAG: alpha-2-macroglobulin family protein [Alcanivoracaceae bacterium]